MGTADHGLLKKSVSGFRKKKQVRPKEGKLQHQGELVGSCKLQWEAPMKPNLRHDRQKEISIGKYSGA